MHVRKGDEVVVLSGKSRGKTGEILRVLREKNRIVVQGVNMVKRHMRPSMGNPGGIIEKEATIHVSNVAHVDPTSKKPTRIGSKVLEDGRKVRYAKRSGEVIDR
ncbi:MAG: 50S ribosomal protein L24 [Alphaproteobacteria bacterium]|nr:50S ribosomal protein L24 [Alphaproteobacteria bacterium]MBT5389696.1 50S ribosomal protein L24 [Alphaproteobacteria bacterium]MBT5654106.1 50S ribosomal protein L24 [Alphaproteobacteria bacterium]